jgi:nucleotide-binding universal stress UspA family protein
MSFSTLMVHVDLDDANDARLRIAGDLAERFDAKVIGIAAGEPQPAHYAGGTFAQKLVAQIRSEIRAQLEQAEERFRSAMKQHAKDIEWRSDLVRPTPYVIHQARAADLIITGVNRNGILPEPFRHLDPSDLVMQAGRPVFVVPPEADRHKLKCALVAWKATREARRAVADALPLLRKVEEVAVIEIIENGADRDAAHHRVDDVSNWLARHGITAFGRVFEARGTDEQILKIWDYGADFIVAGAYGHTRMTEWVFGGFTHSLLTRSKQCSLLTH